MSQDLIRTNRRVARLERERQTEAPGIWMDWTPGLVQGVSVACTPSYARCRLEGKTLKVAMRVSANGAGTAGQIIYVTGMPGTPVASVVAVIVGGVQAYAGGNHAIGGAFLDGSFRLYGIADGSNNGIGALPAITLAVGVIVSVSAEYEIA